jgi:hypothetical protein
MMETLKLFNKLWDAINPQKNLDDHYDKINKAKISKKLREDLIAKVTIAKIVYGYWILLIVTALIVLAGFYFLNHLQG